MQLDTLANWRMCTFNGPDKSGSRPDGQRAREIEAVAADRGHPQLLRYIKNEQPVYLPKHQR